ncbi:putative ABC transporter G family member 43 [Iris pallida]|uniref:ABC transporter G family member 43 n=1 Tax=Iris pallida TaxID=29817 RepID=A0AAX6HW06_IRIPA|nr:putative ABC transporter G family member 43 [Iris pallida]KAJ6844901.1 putative ABC transporter G family member 43 [Iris pallida]
MTRKNALEEKKKRDEAIAFTVSSASSVPAVRDGGSCRLDRLRVGRNGGGRRRPPCRPPCRPRPPSPPVRCRLLQLLRGRLRRLQYQLIIRYHSYCKFPDCHNNMASRE